MGKNSYESRASSSSSKFNGDVRELECWCPRICVVRKSNTNKNSGRLFYVCPLPKVCLTIKNVMSFWFEQHMTDFECNEKRLKMIEKCNIYVIIFPSN